MNMKILSLSLILVIANFMHGMTPEEEIFYRKELYRAKKDLHHATLAENKIHGKLKTSKNKETDEKYQKKLIPANEETYFHHLKVVDLEHLLRGGNLEILIEELEKFTTLLEYAQTHNRVARYLRSLLPENRIESAMPEYL